MNKERSLLERHEVIKASGSIHICHKISLVQQRLWNVLLAHAFNELGEKTQFQISTNELLKHFHYEMRNIDYLKECLTALVGTVVEYNIFLKDSREWGVFSLLAQGNIKDGVCTYAYAPKLQEKLDNPAMYARINLQVQKHIKSKYALFLYELCIDYKGIGQTSWIKLETIRSYMGLKDDEYEKFKDFNFHVIQKPIKEINETSDIFVEVEFQRKERKVIALKLIITKNPKQPNYINQLELPLEQTNPPLEIHNSDITIESTLNLGMINILVAYGVSERQAEKIVKDYPEDKIKGAIEVLKEQQEPVKNAGGFITKAIKEGWQSKSFDPLQEKRKKQREKEAEKEKQKVLEAKERDEKQKQAIEAYKNMTNEERIDHVYAHYLKDKFQYTHLKNEEQNEFKQMLFGVMPTVSTLAVLLSKTALVLSEFDAKQKQKQHELNLKKRAEEEKEQKAQELKRMQEFLASTQKGQKLKETV